MLGVIMYQIEILDKHFELKHTVVFASLVDAEKVFDCLALSIEVNKWAVVALRDLQTDEIWTMSCNRYCG